MFKVRDMNNSCSTNRKLWPSHRLLLVSSVVLFVIFLGSSGLTYARDVTLRWQASEDPTVVGYLVYYKVGPPCPPFNGDDACEGLSPIDVGDVTQVELHCLADSTDYSFTVRAYDLMGNQSVYSNAVFEGELIFREATVSSSSSESSG